MGNEWYGWAPYVSVTERRRRATRAMARLVEKGRELSPVRIRGRAIAQTFWGKAWCDNLERYNDFANRLPRGRTYVRRGSVLDLQIAPGAVQALVSGTDIYEVVVKVTAVPKARWASICVDCAGAIDSLVELLQGHLSTGVMERICREKTGLFPAPAEITFSCSCPDWAVMCKHVAAALYGVGARLDQQPELLFKLRSVDGNKLIAIAGAGLPLSKKGPKEGRLLASGDLSQLFGLEMGTGRERPARAAVRKLAKSPRPRRGARESVAAAKPVPTARTARSRGRRSPRTKRTPSKARAKPKTRKRNSTNRVGGASRT